MTTAARWRVAEKRRKLRHFLDPKDPRGMPSLMRAHLEALKVKGRSEMALVRVEWVLSEFIEWAEARGVNRPQDVTKPILERYQRVLFYKTKQDGTPLTLATQRNRLSDIKQYFRWLARNNYVLSNPASEIELPRCEKRLPKHVLSHEEAERILSQPDLSKPSGIRDRAILETFYSTGVRRSEMAAVKIHDIDTERGTLIVRQGKGKKDRVVPIGERACAWVEKYLRDVRPSFAIEPDEGWLFLSQMGDHLTPMTFGLYTGQYVRRAGLGKVGSCHLFRHAMATQMLENGADIRMIQAMLGHERLTTTEIYTHVSIKKLKEIHTATHPSAKLTRRHAELADDEALLDATQAEGDDDVAGEGGEQG